MHPSIVELTTEPFAAKSIVNLSSMSTKISFRAAPPPIVPVFLLPIGLWTADEDTVLVDNDGTLNFCASTSRGSLYIQAFRFSVDVPCG